MSEPRIGDPATLPAQVAGEFAPLLRRAVALDPDCVARVRSARGAVRLLVRLPFGVLVGRTLDLASAQPDRQATRPTQPAPPLDATVAAQQLLDWVDGTRAAPPEPRDADWRGAAPPDAGWQRIDTVPDAVVRDLVRTGALTLKQTAEREGVPGAQPRADVADALLDSVVLTVSDDRTGARAEVTLRALSALTRMGFLPRGSHVAVDLAGRWTRVAAAYGSVFTERGGLGLVNP